VICIDPKGENARDHRPRPPDQGPGPCPRSLRRHRATLGRLQSARPARPGRPRSRGRRKTLADALVFDEPGKAGEAHWNEEAKALIAGLILHMACASEPRDRRTLATLRDYLTLAPEAFAALLARHAGATAAGGLIARAANRHLGKSDREAAGVFSAAQRHTHFLDSPRMVASHSADPISRFADLKRRNATVFLVLPPDRLATYSRWLRLLVAQSLTDMARDRPPSRPCRSSTCSMSSPPSATSPPSSAPWASWPATASSSGPSCRTFTSSAPPTAARRHLPVERRRPAGVRRQRCCPSRCVVEARRALVAFPSRYQDQFGVSGSTG
jgi:type IV secretion system protein VirD4